MELITIKCKECGAKLRVREETKLVRCEHCDTQLAIDRDDEHREKAAAQNEQLLLEGKIARLDREWEERRRPFMIGREGQQRPPSKAHAIAMGCMMPLVALPLVVPTLAGLPFEAPGFLWLVTAVLVALGGLVCFSMHGKAVAYEKALAEHEAEREELLAQLEGR